MDGAEDMQDEDVQRVMHNIRVSRCLRNQMHDSETNGSVQSLWRECGSSGPWLMSRHLRWCGMDSRARI